MKKRLLALGLILIMAMSTLAGCKKEEKFVVGFDAEFPPYGYKDTNGEYVGFDLDLAAEVCKRLDWELVKQPINWDSKDLELESGTIDCIWNGFTKSKEREDQYTWSEPYVDNSQVVVVKKSSKITKLSDLDGKVVAVQAASSALSALESDAHKDLKKSFKTLQQVADYNTAFLNLESGAVDAVAMDIGVAKYQLENRGDEYIILEEKLITEQYAIGFLKGNTELRDKVQEVFNEMKADGTVEKIAKKYNLEDSIIK